jgi:hypothetical protein
VAATQDVQPDASQDGEEKKSWQAYQQRQQAKLEKRTRELADQAVQLARLEVAQRQKQAQWARRLHRQQSDIESQRMALLTEQSAWLSKQRERIEAAREAPPTDPAASLLAAFDLTAPTSPAAPTPVEQPQQTVAAPAAVSQSTPAAASQSTPAAASQSTPAPATPLTTAQPTAPADVTQPSEPADVVPPTADATALDVAADTPQPPAVPPASIATEAERKAALAAFRRGRQQLEMRQYADAVVALQEVVGIQPQDPLAHYLLALAHHQNGAQTAADQHISTGAELEQQDPIANWGRAMQRYQGRPRLWLERARARAKKNLLNR